MYVEKQFVSDKELFEMKGPFQIATIERKGCLSLFGESWVVHKHKYQSFIDAKIIIDVIVNDLSRERNYNSAFTILHNSKPICTVRPTTDWGANLRLPG